MRDHDSLAGAALVDELDGAPVGDLGDRQPGHVAQRLLVVERRHQRLGGAREEPVAQLGDPLARDVLDDRHRRDRPPVLVVERRRLEQLPAELAGRSG